MSAAVFLCDECGRVFGGHRGFTDHRVNRRCRTPRELSQMGFRLNVHGVWTRPGPDGRQAVLFRKERRDLMASRQSTIAPKPSGAE